MFIYQRNKWPQFYWNNDVLLPVLGEARNLQGRLIGKMEAIGFSLRDEANLEILTLDVLKSSEIEGTLLNPNQVRSSIARKLGMDISGLVPSDRNVDGVVEMTLDAIRNYKLPLTKERLFSWHAALFPSGRSGMLKITMADWRRDETGPMQVVSGPLGKERVHFKAPEAVRINSEMDTFMDWFNRKGFTDPVLKAGIAHLWFVTIHPFDDGNGRIARIIADMQLARVDGIKQRFYSVSTQIRKERKSYYDILEKTQKANLDITEWLYWFLSCLKRSLLATDKTLAGVLHKARFWEINAFIQMNERQRLIINQLLEGFKGKLNSSKYAKIAKCSPDTALRDIQDLISKNILKKESAGGRSTSYILIPGAF